MVMYLWHLRPPPRIWRTSPELKKTSVVPPSAGDEVDLHRTSLDRRWSRSNRRRWCRDCSGGCYVGRWPKRGEVTLLARKTLPPISLSPALLRWSSARTPFPLFAPLAPVPGETVDSRVSSGPGPEVLYALYQPQCSLPYCIQSADSCIPGACLDCFQATNRALYSCGTGLDVVADGRGWPGRDCAGSCLGRGGGFVRIVGFLAVKRERGGWWQKYRGVAARSPSKRRAYADDQAAAANHPALRLAETPTMLACRQLRPARSRLGTHGRVRGNRPSCPLDLRVHLGARSRKILTNS
jgi:hypothetical protein